MNKKHDRRCRVYRVRADGVRQLVEDRRQAQSEGNEDEDVLQVVPPFAFVIAKDHLENLE